jgi:hypothetical protein
VCSREFVDHRIDLALPTEEQVFLVFAERAQTRKRIEEDRDSCARHRVARSAASG